jgi:sortase A
MTVRTSYGTFVYEVHKIRIVDANDRTVIVPTTDAVLTLSTCYPFRFIGNAPKRYIVQAGLVIGEPVA